MTTGTSTSTRKATFGRHGRLLALCGLSLLLHAGLIAWLDAFVVPSPPVPPSAGLAVRLAGAPAPSAAALPAQMPPPAAPGPDVPSAPEELAPPAAPPAPVTRLPPATSTMVRDAAPGAPAQGSDLPQTPSRYRVSMPPAVTLVYEVRDAAGASGEASLRWDTDGVQYRLALDGILGVIESEGGTDDAGISPRRAGYRVGTGNATVAFTREQGSIVFEAYGRSAQDLPGSQDGATVLMQLAGIGRADPDQVQDAVDIYVARQDAAAVERYRVEGPERIGTPAGAMDTVRLVRSGQPRLELWLAPARGWLPVQLRVSAPDGSVRTQVVKEIRNAPAAGPAP